MGRLHEIVKTVEEKYTISVDDVLDLYKRKFSREQMAERLGTSIFTMRQVFDKLGLPAKKSKRAEAYLKFYVELGADDDNLKEVSEAPIKENEFLTRKLQVSQRALSRTRDELRYMRNAERKATREDSIEERVLDVVNSALPIRDKRKYTANITTPTSDTYIDYVSSIILSDLHVEEAVSSKDVGNMNEFNWEVVESRLDKFFGEWFNSYRGESRGVIMMLGDMISGIIHNTLEHTTKPTAEALHDLADVLSGYISTAGMIFDTVDIHFVNGNHGRISEKIKSNNKGFDFEYLFAQILKAKLSSFTNISMNISTTGFVATKIGDKWYGGIHGDSFRSPKSEARTAVIQEAFKQVLGVEVYHIAEGHTHKFSVHNTNRGYSIVNGSLIGSNAYGLTNGYMPITPSQTIVLFKPSGDIDYVKPVYLG